MLSDGERGSRVGSSRSPRMVWAAAGSIWHTPTAPVTETTSPCQPDSHQHVASTSAAGRAQIEAHSWNTGRRPSRAGWATNGAGREPLGTAPTRSPPVGVAPAVRAPGQTDTAADGEPGRRATVVTTATLTSSTTVMTTPVRRARRCRRSRAPVTTRQPDAPGGRRQGPPRLIPTSRIHTGYTGHACGPHRFGSHPVDMTDSPPSGPGDPLSPYPEPDASPSAPAERTPRSSSWSVPVVGHTPKGDIPWGQRQWAPPPPRRSAPDAGPAAAEFRPDRRRAQVLVGGIE